MRSAPPKLIFALLIVIAFTLATCAHLRAISHPDSGSDEGAFAKLLGDGRRLFAGQFVEMADVYFHSGFYPSIFDRRQGKATLAVNIKSAGHDGHHHDEHKANDADSEDEAEHEKEMDFMGPPHDWLEAFIRRFRITEHTHLKNGNEREILPWLDMAIELDPQAIETYTTTAYWLRKDLGKPKAAEKVLREGLRNNPHSSEILFELGDLYRENYTNSVHARNAWCSALRLWEQQDDEAKTNNAALFERVTANLGRLEDEAGNWQRAIDYFEMAKTTSPNPAALQMQIDVIRNKLANPTNAPRASARTP